MQALCNYTNRTIKINWDDTNENGSSFHFIFLRDNCYCDNCGNPKIGRRTLRLTSIDLDTQPKSVEVIDDCLAITWNDDHQSQYSSAWLHEYSYDLTNRETKPHKTILWNNGFINDPPIFQYSSVFNDPKALLDLLNTVRDYGLCFIENAPVEPTTLEPFARQIGPIQENNFGLVQDLVIDNTKRSIANSFEALKPHTDEPYRASPPGLILFHCIETDIHGAGGSVFLDGFEAAETLKQEDPEGFKILCQCRQGFQRHFENDVDLIAEFPVISVDEFNKVCGVRINDRVGAPLSIPFEFVESYYRAYKRLLQLCEDQNRIITKVLKPGDIAIFDNHRVLHGRTEITMNGRRWLQWVQVERGDFHSRMRILSDQLNIPRDNKPFLKGAY